ncbi:MAG TPA: hypothetical protein VFF30_06650 [Nitrososphaerales archaeon]|nr:hypothetical protein [Nitrososphaerales archaeon]
MTEPNKKSPAKTGDDQGDVSSQSILRITDELVHQVDKSKKLVLIMIAAIVAAIPISWHVSPILLGTPYSFRVAGIVSIIIAAAFIAVGVRQWLVLSKWTKKYKSYKAMQKRIDEKLDFEGSENSKDRT